jgi:hypothetical protein
MRMRSCLAGFCILLTGIFTLSGCSDSSSPRSVVHIVSLNGNQPLQSDVVKVVSGTPTVYEDEVAMEVRNDPADAVVNLKPGGPYGYVVLDRYEVHYDNSQEIIPAYSGSLGWTVHTGEVVTGSIVVVPASLKQDLPLFGLVSGGEILATAHITIYGHEGTSGYKLKLESTLPVHFANWAD